MLRMIFFKFIIVLLFGISRRCVGALECYSCRSINSVMTCVSTTHCHSGQSCYLNFTSAGYSLGCIDNQNCGSQPNIVGSLVGRSLEQELNERISDDLIEQRFALRETQPCFECCSSEICNKHLCEHLQPTSCIDDPKVDCAFMNSKFDICKNIHEAKTVCPNFCGLCSLVDGHWADWSPWSRCDVTCANGTKIRARNCTNPSPVGGGLECNGSAKETQICHLTPCPIDGFWSYWSSWSSCDATCQNGTQTRTRVCDNPSPAYGGQYCRDHSFEQIGCFKELCPVHGGWTDWFSWEPCSVTCDFGIQRRHRNCTNPKPEHFGDHCFGDSMDDRICHSQPCNKTSSIVFQCHGLSTLSFNFGNRLVFTNTTFNDGNGYDNASGIFTAPLAGTYSFSAQLCLPYSQGVNLTYSFIHNSVEKKRGYFQGNYHSNQCHDAAFSTILAMHDAIWMEARSQSLLIEDDNAWNTFSGYLVHT